MILSCGLYDGSSHPSIIGAAHTTAFYSIGNPFTCQHMLQAHPKGCQLTEETHFVLGRQDDVQQEGAGEEGEGKGM